MEMEDEEYLRGQIYNSLRLKETEELIEMLQIHDTELWMDMAFEVAKEILQERLGEVPAQGDAVWSQLENARKNGKATEALPAEESTSQPEKRLSCPYCQGENVLERVVELRNRMEQVVLKKPEVNLARFLGMDGDYDEIVGFACEDCGYVFFMLKDFV